MASKPFPMKNRGKLVSSLTPVYKDKFRCPHCGGVDTRRYSARGYIYCFTCDIEIPYPENERMES